MKVQIDNLADLKYNKKAKSPMQANNQPVYYSQIITKNTGNQQNQQSSNLTQSERNPPKSQIHRDDESILNNLLSKIFFGGKTISPHQLPIEFINSKNNILLIFLLVTLYGLYYLLGGFIDTILLAIISGIAYQVLRDSFVSEINQNREFNRTDSLKYRIFRGLMLTIFVIILPSMKKFLGNPQNIQTIASFENIKDQFLLSFRQQYKTILYIQIGIILYVIKLLIGDNNLFRILKLVKVMSLQQKRRIQITKYLFACSFFLVVIIITILIHKVIYKELTATGQIIENQIQLSFNCSLVGNSSTHIQHCTQKLDLSHLLKSGIEGLKTQNETINDCINYAKTIQQKVFGYEIISNAEPVCTWLSILNNLNKYFNENTRYMVISTSQNVLSIIFGNLTGLIFSLLNIIFNLTTFLTVFYLTANYFNPKKNFFSQIISHQHQQFYNNIGNLLYVTFFIVVEHFFLTFIILQVFNFSPINLLLSLALSLMSLFPVFRPWSGMLVCITINFSIKNIRILLSLGEILTAPDLYVGLLLAVIYYLISQKIYSRNYLNMDAHEIIMNLSILFGIYQFGIAGIIYGPLILLLFSCVSSQLLSQKNSPNTKDTQKKLYKKSDTMN